MAYWRFNPTRVFQKMYMAYLFWTIINSARGENCPNGCICEEKSIRCLRIIPDNIPPEINDVQLYKIPAEELVSRRFCSVSWSHNITHFTISGVHGFLNLNHDVFVCFNKLESLHLHDGKILNFSPITFNGLHTLSTLDLSGCDQIYVKDMSTALMHPSILPLLSTVILVQTGSRRNIELTQEIIDEVGLREIREVDLSQTQILYQPVNLDPICDTIRVINLSYTSFDSESDWRNWTRECDSLEVLDVSGMNYPNTHHGPKNLNISNFDIVLDFQTFFSIIPVSFFRSIKKFFISSAFGPDHHIRFSNCTFRVEMNNSLTEWHMSNSGLNLLDVEVILKHNNMQYIDLSFNGMEGISPKLFSNMLQLTNVDLSVNKLFSMEQTSFSELFAKNLLLEEVNLSGNNLNEIPVNMFAHNRAIEYLDLSSNDLQQITFEIKQLLNLSELKMSKNLITYLDAASRKRMDDLYNLKCMQSCNYSSFTVDLQENPFSCGCESLEFIEWFISSPMFDESRSMYSCKFDGQEYAMDTDALAVAKYECALPGLRLKRILFGILIPIAALCLLSFCSYCVYKVVQKRRQSQDYEERRQLLHEYPNEKIPVFLSYSPNDRCIALKYLLKPLSVSKNWLPFSSLLLDVVGRRIQIFLDFIGGASTRNVSDQQRDRPACVFAQSSQCLCFSNI